MHKFFEPESIALVGASERSFWTRNAFENLKQQNYMGQVFLVNPSREEVFDAKAYPRLQEVREPIDLAYIATPGSAVFQVLEDVASAGIKNVVLVNSGFGEAGPEGKIRQLKLSSFARRNGIQLLGPNCPGFLNAYRGVSAYGQSIPDELLAGSVGVILQSGALASGVLKFCAAHGIGVSKLVCMGNEAVLTLTDVLEHMVSDPDTKTIAIFAEQVAQGAKFMALARQALRAGKQIVILKVGRTAAGQKVALAHTGSVAGDDAVVDAALRQCGVTRVGSLEELLVTAGMFARYPPLTGRRMGVVTTSGGACDIIADSADDAGIDLPDFSADTKIFLDGYLPSFASVRNPLDGAAVDTMQSIDSAATPLDVVCRRISGDQNFDFLIYMGFNTLPRVSPVEEEEAETLRARMAEVREIVGASPIPIIPMTQTCLDVGKFARSLYRDAGLHPLSGIDLGMKAIGHALNWAEARDAAGNQSTERAINADPKLTLTETGALSEDAARRLLAEHDVPIVPARLAKTASEARSAADDLGYPVALKICSPDIAHKSDIGGVVLNVADPDGAEAAFSQIQARAANIDGARIEGVLVSPMRPPGTELFAGVRWDPNFGAVLVIGIGGIWIETLKDVNLLVLPVTVDEIADSLLGLRAAPLLQGARGTEPVDIAAISEAIWRMTRLAEAIGPVLETLEINPFWCKGDKVEGLDALLVLSDAPGGQGISSSSDASFHEFETHCRENQIEIPQREAEYVYRLWLSSRALLSSLRNDAAPPGKHS